MKYEFSKLTSYKLFNLLAVTRVAAEIRLAIISGLDIHLHVPVKNIPRVTNKFYISIKILKTDIEKYYTYPNQDPAERVLQAAESKFNHIIGLSNNQIHFTISDVVETVKHNKYVYYFIAID